MDCAKPTTPLVKRTVGAVESATVRNLRSKAGLFQGGESAGLQRFRISRSTRSPDWFIVGALQQHPKERRAGLRGAGEVRDRVEAKRLEVARPAQPPAGRSDGKPRSGPGHRFST